MDDYVKQIERIGAQGVKGGNTPLLKTSEDANIVTSTTGKDPAKATHDPVIDIDVPINIVPASRIGHTHLYINHPCTQDQLFKLLEVMAEMGIVEDGYVQASKITGFSGVRLPWIKKKEDVV